VPELPKFVGGITSESRAKDVLQVLRLAREWLARGRRAFPRRRRLRHEGWTTRRRLAHDGGRSGGAARLLDDVRELVRDEAAPSLRARRVLVRSERHVRPERERSGAEGRCRVRRRWTRVNAYRREVTTETPFHERLRGDGERFAFVGQGPVDVKTGVGSGRMGTVARPAASRTRCLFAVRSRPLIRAERGASTWGGYTGRRHANARSCAAHHLVGDPIGLAFERIPE